MRSVAGKINDEIMDQIMSAIEKMEGITGKFGDKRESAACLRSFRSAESTSGYDIPSRTWTE